MNETEHSTLMPAKMLEHLVLSDFRKEDIYIDNWLVSSNLLFHRHPEMDAMVREEFEDNDLIAFGELDYDGTTCLQCGAVASREIVLTQQLSALW